MIPVTETERKIIQSKNPKHKLKSASSRKRSGGSTYYCLPTDKRSVQLLAELRCMTVAELTGYAGRMNY